MGLGAMKMALMEEYIRVVYGLFARETVETEIEGKQRKIRFLNPEIGLINTDDAIPLHISASGPRGRALTARLAAGWLNFLINIPTALRALDEMRLMERTLVVAVATSRRRSSPWGACWRMVSPAIPSGPWRRPGRVRP